jgi:hypothetical protein
MDLSKNYPYIYNVVQNNDFNKFSQCFDTNQHTPDQILDKFNQLKKLLNIEPIVTITISEEFKSKKQAAYFFHKASTSKGDEKKKWEKMAHEFASKTDFKTLSNKIDEVRKTTHSDDRIGERIKNINDIILPYAIYHEGEDPSVINNLIKREIISSLNNRISILASEPFPIDDTSYAVKIAIITIKRDDKIYKPTIKVATSKNDFEKNESGNFYYAIIYDDKFISLILDKDTCSDDDILSKMKAHALRNPDKYSSNIAISNKHLFSIPLVVNLNDVLSTNIEKEPEVVEKPKMEIPSKNNYKKGAPYSHPKFGNGRIQSVQKIETGVYDVNVLFDKPYGLKKLRLKNASKV